MLNLFELLQMYNEMAYEKRKVLNDIRHTTFQRLRHLIKIFLYRDVRKNDMKHWINEELYNWCSDIPLIKGNKHLSHKELYKVFWDEPKDDINERNINRIVKQFINIDFPKIEYSFNNLYNFIKDFYMWLIEYLTKDFIIDPVDFENKIKELLNKYSIN